MNEVNRYHVVSGRLCEGVPLGMIGVVLVADFDRVTAERDAALAELVKANEKIDKAWNRKSATDHKGFIPGAMDAWKRPVPQHLLYDFSGNPGASATKYCNGWNDSGSYWSAHAYELQQRLPAADERTDLLEGLLREVSSSCALIFEDHDATAETVDLQDRIDAALKPAEGGVYGEMTDADWQLKDDMDRYDDEKDQA